MNLKAHYCRYRMASLQAKLSNINAEMEEIEGSVHEALTSRPRPPMIQIRNTIARGGIVNEEINKTKRAILLLESEMTQI